MFQIIVNNTFYRHPKVSCLRNENRYKWMEQAHHKKSIFLSLCDRHSKRNLISFGKHKFLPQFLNTNQKVIYKYQNCTASTFKKREKTRKVFLIFFKITRTNQGSISTLSLAIYDHHAPTRVYHLRYILCCTLISWLYFKYKRTINSNDISYNHYKCRI